MDGSDHTQKAKAVIEDVFRRADKNDDGALSLKEFQEFFSDGVMTTDELEELFHVIDTSKSNNLSPSELCAYFQQFSADFEPIFSLVDDLGLAISHVMKTTHSKLQSKETSGKVEKFATRFLIKEALEHVNTSGRPLESASDHLTEVAMQERSGDHGPLTVDTTEKRSGVKWHKKYQTLCSTGSSGPHGDQLGSQVDRLATLIDKLEGKVKLETVEEEEVPQGTKDTVTVVHMLLEASENAISGFKQSLKSYVQNVASESGCLHVCVRSYAGTYQFSVYEVWQDSAHLSTHYLTRESKTFRKNNIDHLVKPAEINTLELPASWWPDCNVLF